MKGYGVHRLQAEMKQSRLNELRDAPLDFTYPSLLPASGPGRCSNTGHGLLEFRLRAVLRNPHVQRGGLQPTLVSNGANVQKGSSSSANIITGLRNVVWPPDVANSSPGRTSWPGELFPNPRSSGTDWTDAAVQTEPVLRVYGRCDPCSERDSAIGGLRSTIPSRLCPRNGTPHSRPCAHACLRARRPSSAPGGGLPEPLRATKVQSGSAADWPPPKSGDQEGDGRPGYPKSSRRPSEMATNGRGAMLPSGSGVRERQLPLPCPHPHSVSSLVLQLETAWTADTAAGLCFQQGRGRNKAEGWKWSQENKTLAKCLSRCVSRDDRHRGCHIGCRELTMNPVVSAKISSGGGPHTVSCVRGPGRLRPT